MYGYSEEDALKMNIGHLTPPAKDAEQKEFTRRLIAGEIIISFETQRVTKDGRILDVWLTVTKLKDDMGKLIGIASTERDITERKRTEEELKRHKDHLEELVKVRTAELEAANKELDAFNYSVSHDLRAPLRAIDGYSRMLLEDHSNNLDSEGHRMLNIVRKNTRKMGQLIDDLLALSRFGRQQIMKIKIDMNGLASDIFGELKENSPERVIELAVKPAPSASGDRSMLKQVFVNLFANAIKFTKPVDKPHIEFGGWSEETENVYFVKDNGVGFDMKYEDKLFGVFQRLHSADEFEGTGVGLAIVHRIIKRHGGRVWAEGKINDGATFYFALPKING